MKKTLTAILAIILTCSAMTLAGCGDTNDVGDETTAGDVTTAENENSGAADDETTAGDNGGESSEAGSALELYTKIWDAFGADNQFACGGGDADHMVEGPGVYMINDDNAESFKYLLHVNDELYGMLDSEAATLQHMMNTNTYCSAIVKLKDSSKASEFAEAYKTEIQAQHWMCGFPDKVVVISTGDYIVMAYGHEGNITNLIAACSAVDAQSSVLVDAPAMVE